MLVRESRGLLALLALLAVPAPAAAFWAGGGSGTGTAGVATMPAGAQPAGVASSRTVTVSWPQSTFLGSRLGTYAGGGYALKRYAQGSATATTPNAACAGTIAGASATLACVEANVPYGRWQYTVTPVLQSLTGDESAKSAVVTVATDAPVLNSVTAQNPASGAQTGDVAVAWGSVSGATGYNVYRRSAAGSYDFSAPLNGATALTATTYADPGSGLSGGTTYRYVVRAVAASPAVESPSSNEKGDTVIARPAAPAGAVTATAVAAGSIDVAWSAVAGVAGYNVYRRTSAGAYDFSAPLNGATPVATTGYHDAGAVDGTTYRYTVRAVVLGLGGAQVESAGSSESSAATSDATAPPVPSALSVTSGGNVQGTASCGVASGTRFVNTAGQAAVSVTATIGAAEAGESVAFTATTSGSTPVTATIAAATGATSATTALNLTSLLDGTVTLTVQTRDAAGNLSATRSPANVVRKDTVAGALSNVTYNNVAVFPDTLSGTSECGATIRAMQTVGPHVGNVYTTTVGVGGTFSGFTVDAISLGSYAYDVTATDLAGNASAVTTLSGTILL